MTEPPVAGRPPLLSVEGVSFAYERQAVLDDVSLEVLPDDFLALVGPNGGGKTTLLKILLGILRPRRGRVVRRTSSRGGALGYVPQFATFDQHFPLRVLDAVAMGRLGLRGLWRGESAADRQAARDALARVGVEHLAAAQIGDLSGGELQRVLIARALAGEPEVLLLDEPTAAVDAGSRRRLDAVLAEVHQRIPVVVVTHDPTAIAGRARRVARVDRRLSWLSPDELEHLHCHHHLPHRAEAAP